MNSRAGYPAYSLSRGAPSATWVLLRMAVERCFGGERGIRTPGASQHHWFSRPAPSTARPSLHLARTSENDYNKVCAQSQRKKRWFSAFCPFCRTYRTAAAARGNPFTSIEDSCSHSPIQARCYILMVSSSCQRLLHQIEQPLTPAGLAAFDIAKPCIHPQCVRIL